MGLAALFLAVGCSGSHSPATPGDSGPVKATRFVDPVRAVNMSSADAYEQDDTQATAKTITVGAAAQEHNFYDDATDWAKFSATSGTTYTIETWVFGSADTVVTLYDGSTSLATNDDKGDGTYGSKITWTAPATKTYTIKTASYNSKKGTNLGYTISVTGGSVTPPSGGVTLPQPKKAWTVLVYLDGDNSLSSFAAGNINQMKNVGSDANLNIVLLWDSTDSTHGYYYVQPGTNTLLQDVGEVDMGAVGTAKNFIDYATNNFPADKYMFVYWNHGGAVDRGVCWDDTSGTHLSEVNQKDIMNYAVSRFGKKLEVVGFDACLMATAEIYYQYRNVANYMAASEQTEPGAGWDYNALSVIKSNPTTCTGADVAKSVCTKYAAANSGSSDWTFSAINLAYAPQLGTAINDFATTAMASGVSGSTFNSLASGLSNFTGYTKDLTGLMNAVIASSSMPQAVKDKAAAVKTIITTQLVLQNQYGSTWNNKAFGCSITMKSDTATYDLLDLCADTQWNEFCKFAGFPNS
jgi:hypothetical protein